MTKERGAQVSHPSPLETAKALAHPTRIRILMAMNAPHRTMSPKDFAEETGETIGNSSYHFRRLKKFGFLQLARTEAVRGATEHFYRPVKRALAWTKESDSLPQVILDRVAATGLRGLVEDAGEAIDAGTFNDREDRALAYDKQWVDERAWGELAKLFEGTLEKALEIGSTAAKRREENGGEGFFLASYGLVMFESPRPKTT
jgi:hypothetical protein